QGLRLNNDGVVTTLWAGSPVDTAGVKVSDMIWSLGKNEQVPQDHKKLETQLAALAPGQHTLYIANNADFTKAQSDVAFNRASSLNPKRHKVLLMI
ncbi:MAG TPA: hypothetical protein VN963_11005, partial [bacterium]|nr:hypothetical protein [bacterium]